MSKGLAKEDSQSDKQSKHNTRMDLYDMSFAFSESSNNNPREKAISTDNKPLVMDVTSRRMRSSTCNAIKESVV